MPNYGFDCYGIDWEGEAPTLADAIATAEHDTGRKVCRGGQTDHWTKPKPGEFVDLPAFRRAMRTLEQAADRMRANAK